MRIHTLAPAFLFLACASSAPARLPTPAPNALAARDQPSFPALRAYQGRVPLVSLAQRPAPGEQFVPTFRLAVFDDGAVLYEGVRCVKVGGMVITRLAPDDVAKLRSFLAPVCADLNSPPSDELCQEHERIIDVTCADGERTRVHSNRCLRPEAHEAITLLAAQILERVAGPGWLGTPTERQACDPHAAVLSDPDWFPVRSKR